MGADLSVRLLPEIYGCAEAMPRWRGILDQICEGLGTRSAVVQIFRREGSRLRQCWCERDTYSAYHAQHHDAVVNNDDNPRIRDIPIELTLAKVVTDDHYLPPRDLAEIQRRLALIGLRGGTSILVEMSPEYYFSMILHRAHDDCTGLDDQDSRLLEDLAPHLQQASRLAVRAIKDRQAGAGIAAMADRLRLGMILCTRDGEVRWCNPAAELAIGRSATLTLAGGRIRCKRPSASPQWLRLLDTSTPVGEAAFLSDADGRTIELMAFPASSAASDMWAGEELVSLILLESAQAPCLRAEAVRSLFGLTSAEASLAAALCDGASLNQYATERGIAVGTARVHMKRILGKTDSPRQADLVRKMCGSVIAQVRQPH
jgi:DNA-binding CsgD family transcriptional regulator/PAS domain-containing protein